jgi:Uma2 family endonuclease
MKSAVALKNALISNSEQDDPLFEIIDGQRVELPPMGIYAVRIASRLGYFFQLHAQNNNLGEAVVEGLFRLSLPVDRNRRPDVAFVSYQRWPKAKPQSGRDNAWEVVPEVAVEVVSPSDLVGELMEKIEEYFEAGVSLVLVVFPDQKRMHVYSSPTQIRVLTRQDTLEGGQALPGFNLPLSNLFLEEAPS